MKPRKPTEIEIESLVDTLVFKYGFQPFDDEVRQLRDEVENAAISVFDNYITDGPGYAGKVMTVVWPGSPTFFQCFVEEDEHGGKYWQDCVQDPQFQAENIL
jgi:hypothetical protein